jgi:hypothetical protein
MNIKDRLRDMQSKKYNHTWSAWVQKQCAEAAAHIEAQERRIADLMALVPTQEPSEDFERRKCAALKSAKYLFDHSKNTLGLYTLDNFQVIESFINRSVTPSSANAVDADTIIDALEIGLECMQDLAAHTHAAYAGYRPDKHAAVDADVAKIKAAIAAMKAAK